MSGSAGVIGEVVAGEADAVLMKMGETGQEIGRRSTSLGSKLWDRQSQDRMEAFGRRLVSIGLKEPLTFFSFYFYTILIILLFIAFVKRIAIPLFFFFGGKGSKHEIFQE